jgi:hypothetical protein
MIKIPSPIRTQSCPLIFFRFPSGCGNKPTSTSMGALVGTITNRRGFVPSNGTTMIILN